jgi:selenocysteine-specific elongation factor
VLVGPRQLPARVRAIQTLGLPVERIDPGNRVALNLTGVEHADVGRGMAVVRPGQWRPTQRCDASLTVLGALDHPVSRRGAYVAYVGSGEFPVRLRVLGRDEVPPGGIAPVRLHLATPLPLLPGDRFVLRESGRSETVGGGEVLDVAPVLPASRARPDRSVDRVVAERGWATADELEVLTGERRDPVLGRWVAAPGAVEALVAQVAERVAGAGPLGLDVATLDEREREALALLPGVAVADGRARPAAAADPLADHPFVAALVTGGFTPPSPDGVDRAELRALVQRGMVVERDGTYFAPATLDAAARVAASLLVTHPDGFTVAELRDAVGASRKHVLPLLAELDARGVTRRRGDLRIGGPRLPAP